jgi:glucose/mannose-6-phosphate isomerase
MNILDAADKVRALDKSGMYDKIHDFPEQIEQALELGRALEINRETYGTIGNIIVAGMGGSAIGGELVRSYLNDSLTVPFHICRNYSLPAFADDKTLVIVSSYSGNTEETLAALNDAITRGCSVICLTSDGTIGELARERGFVRAVLPPGYPPRAALGFSFVPLLMILSKLGFCPDPQNDLKEVAAGLRAYRTRYALESVADQNPAKKLAMKLHGKIPIIYSGPDRFDAVGTRWKGQICENAEMPAFCNVFPEFNHNELVGWNILGDFRKLAIVVYLRDNDDNERIKARMEAVRDLLSREKIEIVDIYSQGDFVLGRIFSLIQLGDFASFYLAVLNGVDPTPVKAIDYLKDRLSQIS